LSRRDEFAGKVDASDHAAITVRGEPGCATQPASDIEHMHGRQQCELIQEIFRGLPAPDVEFIHGTKVFDSYRCLGLSERADTVADRSE
jgi:hypothetical protein